MKALVRARGVAAPAEDVPTLACPGRCDERFGSDGIPRTLRSSHQFECNPMIIVLHHVAKQHGRGVYSVQDNIDMAVIEEVSKRRAARRNHHTQTAARCRCAQVVPQSR
jgi:putative hemolysin